MRAVLSALAPEIARSDRRISCSSPLEQVRKDLELLVGLLPGKDKSAARSRAILDFQGRSSERCRWPRAVSDDVLSHEILTTVADLLKNPA